MKYTNERGGRRGVYFLSNDKMIELTLACLNSFRKYNPDIPACVIPFNNELEKIERLKSVYHFDIFKNEDLLHQCDEISIKFHGAIKGAYRKLAMWEGPFDEFIYVDIDTIVLKNLDFVFPLLSDFDCLTSHSDLPGIRKFVWKDSIYDVECLTREQIDFAASTGFIVSHKKFMTFDWILSRVDAGLSIRHHMELFCQEQSFLNFLIVTKGKPFSSLLTLRNSYENIMLERWGGRRIAGVKDGKINFDDGNPVFLVHWAGVWHPSRWDRLFHKVITSLGVSKRSPQMNSMMPNKKLWKYYRHLGETV